MYARDRVTYETLPRNVTSFELLHGQKPDLSNFRVFESRFWYKVVDHKVKKLVGRAAEEILIRHTSGGRSYNLCDSQKRRVIVSRIVRFVERSVLDKTSKPTDDEEYAEFSLSYKTSSVDSSVPDKPHNAAQVHLSENNAPDPAPESTRYSSIVDLIPAAIDDSEAQEASPVHRSTRKCM